MSMATFTVVFVILSQAIYCISAAGLKNGPQCGDGFCRVDDQCCSFSKPPVCQSSKVSCDFKAGPVCGVGGNCHLGDQCCKGRCLSAESVCQPLDQQTPQSPQSPRDPLPQKFGPKCGNGFCRVGFQCCNGKCENAGLVCQTLDQQSQSPQSPQTQTPRDPLPPKRGPKCGNGFCRLHDQCCSSNPAICQSSKISCDFQAGPICGGGNCRLGDQCCNGRCENAGSVCQTSDPQNKQSPQSPRDPLPQKFGPKCGNGLCRVGFQCCNGKCENAGSICQTLDQQNQIPHSPKTPRDPLLQPKFGPKCGNGFCRVSFQCCNGKCENAGSICQTLDQQNQIPHSPQTPRDPLPPKFGPKCGNGFCRVGFQCCNGRCENVGSVCQTSDHQQNQQSPQSPRDDFVSVLPPHPQNSGPKCGHGFCLQGFQCCNRQCQIAGFTCQTSDQQNQQSPRDEFVSVLPPHPQNFGLKCGHGFCVQGFQCCNRQCQIVGFTCQTLDQQNQQSPQNPQSPRDPDNFIPIRPPKKTGPKCGNGFCPLGLQCCNGRCENAGSICQTLDQQNQSPQSPRDPLPPVLPPKTGPRCGNGFCRVGGQCWSICQTLDQQNQIPHSPQTPRDLDIPLPILPPRKTGPKCGNGFCRLGFQCCNGRCENAGFTCQTLDQQNQQNQSPQSPQSPRDPVLSTSPTRGPFCGGRGLRCRFGDLCCNNRCQSGGETCVGGQIPADDVVRCTDSIQCPFCNACLEGKCELVEFGCGAPPPKFAGDFLVNQPEILKDPIQKDSLRKPQSPGANNCVTCTSTECTADFECLKKLRLVGTEPTTFTFT